MKKTILILLILFSCKISIYAQEERVIISDSKKKGADNTKKITKIVRFVDADTEKSIPAVYFSVVKNYMVIYGGKSDEMGYARLLFNMNNYYPTVEINMNDNKYRPVEDTVRRNKILYQPVAETIKFKSGKDVVDTVIVQLKKLPDVKR